MSGEKIVTICSKIKGLSDHVRSVLPLCHTIKFIPDFDESVVKSSDYIIADNDRLLTGGFLSLAPGRARWIQCTWAGVEGMASNARSTGVYPTIPLARFSHPSFSRIMAEYCVAAVINMERRFSQVKRSQVNHHWDLGEELREYRAMDEMTVGVLGVGNMGVATAEMMSGLGCKVLGLVGSPRQPQHGVDRFYTMEQLGEMLSKVDYILSMLPSTPATDDILGRGVLKNCAGRGVGLVNIGRGNVISDDDLLDALEKGWIKSAVLDVFREEPLPQDSKLWDHPGVDVTPHIAGISRPKDIAECFKRNLDRESQGLEPDCLVDWNKLY